MFLVLGAPGWEAAEGEDMDDPMYEFELRVAGSRVPDIWDRIRRYCGLPWSGGPAETWAYRYYDVVETEHSRVGPLDVLTAAALHPALSRTDLGYFHDNASRIDAWLSATPVDVPLRDAGEELIGHLEALTTWPAAPSLSLMTKVLHRKRPQLVPLVDRHVLDCYRPLTGERSAAAAWPGLLRGLRDDLAGQNAMLLTKINVALEQELGRGLTHTRLLDIAVWMGSRG